MIKKLLKILVITSVAVLIVASSLSAFAAKTQFNNGFGTEASGIVGSNGQIWHNDATEGPKNFDFSEGFKYWGTGAGPSPSTVSEIVTVDGKSALHLKPKKQYDGIQSTPFTLSDVSLGSKVSVAYDWKGEGEFALQLNQVDKGWIATYRDDKIISEDINGWNTSVSTPTGQVEAEDDPSIPTTFSLVIQAADPDDYIDECDIYITNIRLVTVSSDGQVREYKTGNVLTFEQPDSGNNDSGDSSGDGGNEPGPGDSIGDLFDDDDDDDTTIGATPSGDADANDDANTNSDADADDEGGLSTTVLIIIIAGSVVLFAAIIVVVLLILKKKKS